MNMQLNYPRIWLFLHNKENDALEINPIMKCMRCNDKKEHKQSGFRHHNYRLTCLTCGEINYMENDE